MTIKKGDLVVPTGVLKEVVDFLASAEGEKLRLLKAFLDGDEPVKDAKYLLASRKVNKIYKDSLEVTFSKDYVWEERKEYWIEVAIEPKAKTNRRVAAVAKDIQDPQPLPSSSGWVGEPIAIFDSK